MRIVILTGAGISAESGIKTFRDNDGLWENHRIEEVATPQAFRANPELVHNFYNLRRAQLLSGDVKENKAHIALAQLESCIDPKSFLLVTQNVDNLHERAGSKNLIHMHGELLKIHCVSCGEISKWQKDLSVDSKCENCNKQRVLRPHIVWFGEMPLQMEKIFASLENCDLFVSIGTSGNVYPAAGFVEVAKNVAKARTVEINLDPTPQAQFFDEKLRGKAGDEVPKFVDELIKYL